MYVMNVLYKRNGVYYFAGFIFAGSFAGSNGDGVGLSSISSPAA